MSLLDLLDKLRLTEKGQLKRAAIILFGKTPAKFYPNTFVKIGRFGKDDADIKFQEIEEGNLIVSLQAVLNQLNHKFLIRPIEFAGMHRIEKSESPISAMREMLLNALVHRNYMGAPIQIRVYDDKISIWNEGTLPEGLTPDALKHSHSSSPRNPIIEDVTFKGGYIDAWGRGTIRILDTCKQAELPEPDMKERDGGFIVTLYKDKLKVGEKVGENLTQNQLLIIKYIKEKNIISAKELSIKIGISDRKVEENIKKLKEKNIIKRIGPARGGYWEI